MRIGTADAAGRWKRVYQILEAQSVTREEIEALVLRERPGWRVVDVVEINAESGPSFGVAVEGCGERRTVLVSADGRVVDERP